MIAWSIDCFGGAEKASHVMGVCQVLDLLGFLRPPFILQFLSLALDFDLCLCMSFLLRMTVDVILPSTEGFPFQVDKAPDVRIIFIEPGLMFPGFVANCFLTCIENDSLKVAPICFSTFWMLLRQSFVKQGLKMVYFIGVLSILDMKFTLDLLLLKHSFWHYLGGDHGMDKAMVTPAVVSTCHGSCKEKVLTSRARTMM